MTAQFENSLQSDASQDFSPVAPFGLSTSGFSVAAPGAEGFSGRIHLIGMSQNAERTDDAVGDATTNGVLNLDYFSAHNGAKKLASTMIIHACTTLIQPDGDSKVGRLKAVELAWLRGEQSVVSFRDCLEMLNLEGFEQRLAEKIVSAPRECLDHFRAMYCHFDQEAEVDQDDQGYRVSGLPRMVA